MVHRFVWNCRTTQVTVSGDALGADSEYGGLVGWTESSDV